MPVSKIWGLAAGLFFVSIMASSVQLSAAMPKGAKVSKAQIERGVSADEALLRDRTTHIPMVAVGCERPQGGAHLIAQCAIQTSAK